MKYLAPILFIILVASAVYAVTIDTNCVNACMKQGYPFGYCQKICTYND